MMSMKEYQMERVKDRKSSADLHQIIVYYMFIIGTGPWLDHKSLKLNSKNSYK